MNAVNTTQLNVEHNDWLRSLEFYKGELGILKGRLTEVAGKNTGEEASKGAEHFENQFKIQITNIDILHHDVVAHLAEIAGQAEHSAGHAVKETMSQHSTLRSRYIAEEKAVNELRHEFYKYAAEWM